MATTLLLAKSFPWTSAVWTTEAVELSKYYLPALVQNTSLLEQINYRHVQFDDVFDGVYAVSLWTPIYVYRTGLRHRTQRCFDWLFFNCACGKSLRD